MVLKILSYGGGWGGPRGSWIVQKDKNQDYVLVKKTDEVYSGHPKSPKEYTLSDCFSMLDEIETCRFAETGYCTIDHQDDRVYRINKDGTQDLIFQTEGKWVLPTSEYIKEMLSNLIDLLHGIDSMKIMI